MKDGDKFVHDNEFHSNKASKGALSVEEQEKLFEETVLRLYLILLNTPDTA